MESMTLINLQLLLTLDLVSRLQKRSIQISSIPPDCTSGDSSIIRLDLFNTPGHPSEHPPRCVELPFNNRAVVLTPRRSQNTTQEVFDVQ